MAPYPEQSISAPAPARLALADLEQALQATDPAALFVAPRLLRRIIKSDTKIRSFGLRVPHRKTYVIGREALLQIVDHADLGLNPAAPLADVLILIARPDRSSLESLTADQLLLKLWRQLFHASIHRTLEERVRAGGLTPALARRRLDEIGRSEYREIFGVLSQDDFLLPPGDDLAIYIEFSAVYWEWRAFAKSFLDLYFPAIEDQGRVEEILGQDLDYQAILAATRPPGAPDAIDPAVAAMAPPIEQEHEVEASADDPPLSSPRKTLLDRATRASQVGNVVRAAILRTLAAHAASKHASHRLHEAALEDLKRLVDRLRDALKFSETESEEWFKALSPVLEASTHHVWSPEARFLYDLQKACVDHERGVYALDMARWLSSLGKAPLKRPLPNQRDVLISKHLRSAAHRLNATRLPRRDRLRVAALLDSSVHRAEERLRSKFRGAICSVLDEVQLIPQNLPERVAREKLVEELLDRIVERDLLTIGDVRDALSRNNLKLPDLTSPEQAIEGDALLQADRLLATRADGVYRRAEIYLRLPQMLSSVAFGVPLGRFFTRFVALPFGALFLTLAGLKELIDVSFHALKYIGVETEVPPWVHHMHKRGPVLTLGFILLLILHHRGFRQLCGRIVRGVGRGLRGVFFDGPSWLFQLPALRRILASATFRRVRQFAIKPALITAAITAPMALLGTTTPGAVSALAIFASVNVLLNSRWGRNADEALTDWLVHSWHKLRIHVIAATLRWIVDFFHWLLETIERLLYAVDEWLRFRSGEGPGTTLLKTVLGVIWTFVNYFIRIYVNLLIEPTFNPIKHFPVVTVAAKILIPVDPLLISLIATPLAPAIGVVWVRTLAGLTVVFIPGVFGFLVWELKENWRLFEANRPRDLQPVIVGSHGETVPRLLRRGFHSGRVPKLFSRMRRACRQGYWTGQWKSARKSHEVLQHITEDVRHFIDRELVNLLTQSVGWGGAALTTGEIHLATERILVELYCPDLAEESFWFALEEDSGVLVASVWRRGWLDQLGPELRRALESALAGLYQIAGAGLVVEQIESHLEPGATYEVTDMGLVLKSGPGGRDVRQYSVYPPVAPAIGYPTPAAIEKERKARELIFARSPITWRSWLIVWRLDGEGTGPPQRILPDIGLYPRD